MTGFRILCAAMALLLCAAAPAAVPESVAPASGAFHASVSGIDQPEERQFQATRLLNMLASMVRERSPLLARLLTLIGLVLKFLTNRIFLRVLLLLLVGGGAAAAALLAWAARKRKMAARSDPAATRILRPLS